MTVSVLRPDSTVSNTGAVTGAGGNLAVALSDDSDASFVTLDFGEASRVGLGDLTLPAGALIKSVTPRIRSAKTAGSSATARLATDIPAVGTAVQSITWAVPTTTSYTTTQVAGITDSEVDAAYIDLSHAGLDSSADLTFYEVYLDITYATLPVVTPSAPTGTVTDTNLPTTVWANTLDSDGGAQTNYQVKIFTAAQYGIGGFDPATSPNTLDSGVLSGADLSWQATAPLADAVYRSYVQVAQTVNGVAHWSAWNFTGYTISVVLPGAPTFVATADSANGRIALAVTDVPGTASTDAFELQRSLDAGTTWEAVRTLDADGFIDVPFIVATGVFSDTADGTTHNAVLPAPVGGILANDMLIAVAGMDGNPTFTWPAGWTSIKDEAGNGSAVRASVAWKRAAGGESGTIAVTTGASEGGGIRILCVRNASTTTAPEVSTGVNSSAANANPDSLNPAGWATEATLWIAAMVLDGDVAVTAGSSGYYDFGNSRWANASGAGVATASLLSVAASADPGVFTHTLEDSRAFTIGVRPRNATLTVYDYEAPNGTTMSYRARSLHDYAGVWAASAWVSDTEAWSSTSWWLKHPHRPNLNRVVRVRGLQTVSRAGRQGVFQALGATNAVVVSDTRGPKTGTVTFRLDTLVEQAALDALLDTVATLMLQSPAGGGGPDYVRFADQERQRVVDWQNAAQVFDANGFTVVASPSGDVAGAWP